MECIRAACVSHGLVVLNGVESLTADILLLFGHAGQFRIAENNVEDITEASKANSVTIANLESEMVLQKYSLVARVTAVRAETLERRTDFD